MLVELDQKQREQMLVDLMKRQSA
jgi:hypothetical protein